MVQGESKVAELESKAFQLVKSLDAGVNVDLLSKTIISVMGDKHHGHPVIAGVTRNLFRATANYIFHKDLFSCRTFIGHTLSGVPRATKKGYGLSGEKRDAAFHLRVLRLMLQTAQYSQSQL